MAVQIERDVYPKTSKLAALYEAVGWSAYTQDEASLTRAVAQSLAVVTAWEGEERWLDWLGPWAMGKAYFLSRMCWCTRSIRDMGLEALW